MTILYADTYPVAPALTVITPDGTKLVNREVRWPKVIQSEEHLRLLGEQLVYIMCARNRKPKLTFDLNSVTTVVDATVIEECFVWQPRETNGKVFSYWSRESVIAAITVNALVAALPDWSEAIKRETVRCWTMANEGTVTVHLSFKGKLHPHRIRYDLIS